LRSPKRLKDRFDAYPKWQAWMRKKQLRLLVIWGKYDLSFDLSAPEAYRRDVPNDLGTTGPTQKSGSVDLEHIRCPRHRTNTESETWAW
jgi:hypothetical protein